MKSCRTCAYRGYDKDSPPCNTCREMHDNVTYPIYPAFCSIPISEQPRYEESCYFYCSEQDMNACIPTCSYSNDIDPLGCNKKCPHYFDRKEVFKIIKEKVDSRDTKASV